MPNVPDNESTAPLFGESVPLFVSLRSQFFIMVALKIFAAVSLTAGREALFPVVLLAGNFIGMKIEPFKVLLFPEKRGDFSQFEIGSSAQTGVDGREKSPEVSVTNSFMHNNWD